MVGHTRGQTSGWEARQGAGRAGPRPRLGLALEASASESAESSRSQARWQLGLRHPTWPFPGQGRPNGIPGSLPCLPAPWALGLPLLLFRRAPWTPCPPCPMGLCPPVAPCRQPVYPVDAVSCHAEGQCSLARSNTLLLHPGGSPGVSVTCVLWTEKAVPGSVIRAGRGGSLAGERAQSARHLQGPGVWGFQTQQPQAAVGQPLATWDAIACPAGGRSPSRALPSWVRGQVSWAGRGPMENILGVQGRD